MSAHLDRLLFAQGGTCFFCHNPLPKAEASVEHLVASANGGANADDNCVACCKALNQLLGAKSIKEKLQIVLNQRGNFKCPANLATQPQQPAPGLVDKGNSSAVSATKPTAAKVSSATQEKLELILADLKKRGASRPRKTSTLTSTIKALIKQHRQENLSDADLAGLIGELQRQGKVTISEGKVAYKVG